MFFINKKLKISLISSEKKSERFYLVMKIGFLSFIVFAFVSCGFQGLETGTKDACHFRVDRGFSVKWESLPILVYIHESVPDISRKNFVYAIDMWNESWNYYTGKGLLFDLVGEVQLKHVPGKNAPDDGVNVFFLDRKYKILSAHQQGSTHVRNYFGGSIYEADIILNSIDYELYHERGFFDYSVYTKVPKLSTERFLASTSPESFWGHFLYAFKAVLKFFTFWKKDEEKRSPSARKVPISKREVDFISLSLHELGHLAAMVHIENTPSIMNPKLSRGQIRRDIGEIELSNLACGYGK